MLVFFYNHKHTTQCCFLQPYLALAQDLKELGHKVQIATGNSFQAFVESYNIAFYPLVADFHTINIDPKLLEAASNSTSPLKMLLTFNKMKKYASYMVDDMYNTCQGSELIIHHPDCSIGYFVAEKLGIQSVLASPFPILHIKEIGKETYLPSKQLQDFLAGGEKNYLLWIWLYVQCKGKRILCENCMRNFE